MRKAILAASTALLLTLTATPAQAFVVGDSWGMVPNGSGVIAELGGSGHNIVLSAGGWAAVNNGVDWNTAPAFGTASGTATLDPGTKIAAIGARITSDPIPASNYSGNVIQKGLFNDGQQIKLQLVPDNQGTFSCRFDGTLADTILTSTVSVNVDDGAQHWAVCIRNGSTLKIVTDAGTTTRTLDVGSISPGRAILVGNRGTSGDATDQHFGRNICSAYSYGSGAINFVQTTVTNNC